MNLDDISGKPKWLIKVDALHIGYLKQECFYFTLNFYFLFYLDLIFCRKNLLHLPDKLSVVVFNISYVTQSISRYITNISAANKDF